MKSKFILYCNEQLINTSNNFLESSKRKGEKKKKIYKLSFRRQQCHNKGSQLGNYPSNPQLKKRCSLTEIREHKNFTLENIPSVYKYMTIKIIMNHTPSSHILSISWYTGGS